MDSNASMGRRGQYTTDIKVNYNNAEKQRNIVYVDWMIRFVGITVGLVILTVGGGISLSNAHGSAGKAAISSPDPVEPDNAELGRLAWPAQAELNADAPTADEMSNVVSKDVSRANVMRWRLFGSTLAPETGHRPKSRGNASTQTAHASGDLVFDAPVIVPNVKPAATSTLRKHTFVNPQPGKIPVRKRRSMNDSPKPGYLIGVFR